MAKQDQELLAIARVKRILSTLSQNVRLNVLRYVTDSEFAAVEDARVNAQKALGSQPHPAYEAVQGNAAGVGR